MGIFKNEEEKEFFNFRIRALNKKIKDIESLVNGRGSLIIPYITDENGKYSDKKTDCFITELLNLSRLKENNDEDALLREFYTCFLYCTICGIVNEQRKEIYDKREDFIKLYPVTKFVDITDMANDPETLIIESVKELWKMEIDSEYYASRGTGFFNCCDLAYKTLFDKDIMSLCPEDIRSELKTPLDEENEYFAEQEGFDSVDEYLDARFDRLPIDDGFDSWEEMDEYYDSISDTEPVYNETDEFILKYIEQMKKSRLMWKENVASPEKFAEMYKRYRELYFEVDKDKMTEDINEMIDTFLYEHKLSAFSLGDKYGKISYRLDTVKSILENEMRKAGCNI